MQDNSDLIPETFCSVGDLCDLHGTYASCSSSPILHQPAFSIPRLEIYSFDTSPFSASFPGLLEYENDIKEVEEHHAWLKADMSYDIERFTNVQDLDPNWDDDEVDEIVIMSPKICKTSGRLPTIAEDLYETDTLSEKVAISDFELLKSPRNAFTAKTTICRKRDTGQMYTLKRFRRCTTLILSEKAVLEAIRDLRAPFLPRLHWSFQDKDSLHLVMDFYPGGDLSHLTSNGPLAPDDVLFYASEIVEAISRLHDAGIIHRDLKPENVMIDSQGHVVLINFGCAKILEFSKPSRQYHMRSASACGVREYQAPEILLGWTHDFAVDCWGFGILMYFMLFGKHPFGGDEGVDNSSAWQQKVLYDAIPFDSGRPVSAATEDLIRKCLERNPVVRVDIQEIKMHQYFAAVDWRQLSNKYIHAPYVPNVDTSFLDLESTPGNTPEIKGDDLKRLSQYHDAADESSQTVYASKAIAAAPRIQHVPALPQISRMSSLLDNFPQPVERTKPWNHGLGIPEHTTTKSEAAAELEARTTAEERMTLFWKTLDSEKASNSPTDSPDFADGLSAGLRRPQRLRKRRSSVYPEQRLSTLSTASQNKLRKRSRSSSTLQHADRNQALDLPKGVEQIGKGIGYTYNLPYASRSKVSICTAAPRACQNLLSKLSSRRIRLGFRLGLGSRKAAKVEQQPLHQTSSFSSVIDIKDPATGRRDIPFIRSIYGGSSWSLGSPISPSVNATSPKLSLGTSNTSPISDCGPLTPDTVMYEEQETMMPGHFQEHVSIEVKEGDPDTTLRLVSPSRLASGGRQVPFEVPLLEEVLVQ